MELYFLMYDHIKKKCSVTGNHGFTLMELLVAIAVFSILSIGIVTIFDSLQRGYTTQQVTSDVLQKARSALNYMNLEIKHAGLDPSESNDFRIRTANAAVFEFDSDASPFDGVLNSISTKPHERKTFRFAGGKLLIDNSRGLANQQLNIDLIPSVDIANSRFEYFDSDMAPLASPVASDDLSSIAAVRITVSVREPAGRDGFVTRTMNNLVLCRNAQFNNQ